MKKLLVVAFALAMVGSLKVSADSGWSQSAKDCNWLREEMIRSLTSNQGDYAIQRFVEEYSNNNYLKDKFKEGNADTTAPSPDFIRGLAAFTQRSCLLKYTENLKNGFSECVNWVRQRQTKGDKGTVQQYCGAN